MYYLFWDIFQFFIGGAIDKQKICLESANSFENILEVGCATGNIAVSFKKKKGSFTYTGIDIDKVTIERAKSKRMGHNFKFECVKFSDFVEKTDEKFDCILLAGFFHHITDELCVEIIKDAKKLLARNGRIFIIDPLKPEENSSFLVKLYARFLERGEYLRNEEAFKKLLVRADQDLAEAQFQKVDIGATPFGCPVCAHFLRVTI